MAKPEKHAAGWTAVESSLKLAAEQMGAVRSARTLLKLNHTDGFDCPSCAWPDPEDRKLAEFCENGARAVAWEATRKTVDRQFFKAHSVSELLTWPAHDLEAQGRLAEPMYLPSGKDHYEPIGWDDAFAKIARRMPIESPDRAVFYTSGRASNEAAFVYQLLARRLGTNNLPDCSNMCHESSGAALTETIGIGKGPVTLADITDHADLIIVAGQNPGTNHPRMLTALEEAKRRGARVVAINPLPEAGFGRFRNPQSLRGMIRGTQIADRIVPVKINGDLALFAALNRILVQRDAIDHDFIARHTTGFDEAAAAWQGLDPVALAADSGIPDVETLADEVVAAPRIIVCWAMGLTQHRNAVATIREVVNFLLLRGNIGRPGAGPCPVRGHSNVQGDRTMGIWEKMPDAFLDALRDEFGFDPPRRHGWDTVDSIRAMRDGRVDVFFALGGNFVAATPDTNTTEQAMAKCRLTVHVATKLNRSHLIHGVEATATETSS